MTTGLDTIVITELWQANFIKLMLFHAPVWNHIRPQAARMVFLQEPKLQPNPSRIHDMCEKKPNRYRMHQTRYVGKDMCVRSREVLLRKGEATFRSPPERPRLDPVQ